MINREKIKNDLCCDDDFLMLLLEQFDTDCIETEEKLIEAMNNKDWPLVKGVSHKMLSSTRIFNMEDLTVTLKEIEILAEKHDNVEKIQELIHILIKQLHATKEELNQV